MKRKLDLNGLLAKYEGYSNTHNGSYYSPPQEYDTYVKDATVDNFYQSRKINTVYEQPVRYASTQPITGNFQMSKSQCEQFLKRVREQLRSQELGLKNFSAVAYKAIQEKFAANHERIRREILDLLERSFKQNEQSIMEELRRQGSSEPVEFVPVHKKIASIDEELLRLLHGLNGVEYRKSIAETVMKDFNTQINALRDNIVVAKDNYLSGLGEVEPDRERIECIRTDLQRLFRISKKNTALIQQTILGALGGMGTASKNPQYSAVQSQVQPQQKQRKSFFNFGLN